MKTKLKLLDIPTNRDIDTFENKRDINKNRQTIVFEVSEIRSKQTKIQLKEFSKELTTLAFLIELRKSIKK